MKKNIKTVLIIVATIIGLLAIIKIFSEIPIRDTISLLLKAKPWAVWMFIGVSLIMMIVHALRWHIIIRAQTGKKISLLKLIQYKIVGFGISFITPAAKVGGEPLRAALLKKEGIEFKEGLSGVVIDKIIDLSCMAVLFAIAIIFSVTSIPLPKGVVIFFLSLAGVFLIGVIYIYTQLLRKKNLFLQIFKFFRLHKTKKLRHMEQNLIDFEKIVVEFHNNKRKAFYSSMVWSFLNWCLMFAEYTSVLAIFGITGVGLQGTFLIITFMGAAYLFPVPLALGVLEAGQIAIFSGLGLPVAAGVGLAMIIRFRDLAWTCISVPILGIHGFSLKKSYKKALQEQELGLIPSLHKQNHLAVIFSTPSLSFESKKTSIVKQAKRLRIVTLSLPEHVTQLYEKRKRESKHTKKK
ncbi:MAG: lysylphosphatidylglycerol synthase transmembrane domain-containing protein [Candidatus Woesearchaeota archaeon]